MKTFLTSILFLILHFNSKAQWIELNVGNTAASNFTDVYAITPDIVIVVGTNGIILKTTDGGATWQQKNSGTTQNLGKIQFPKSDIGYVVEGGGKLLKTIDGGETWLSIPITVENINSIYSLSCVNENVVFLSCIDSNSNSILLKSSNGGSSWEKVIGNDSQAKFYEIQFFSGEIGYASSDYSSSYASKILKTQDGGKSWIQFDDSISPFGFINENLGFYYQGGFLKTTEGGNDFVKLGSGSLHSLSKVFPINENTVWGIYNEQTMCGCGTRGLVRMTYSSENGYKEYLQNQSAYMSSIYFSDVKLGYAVGVENGKAKVWKNTTADLTLDAKENELKNSIRIFPNPTSDKINISINNKFSQEFIISISDMTGKRIYNQNFKNKNELTIDVRSFAKGTYILTIQNQKQPYSQKVIIN